MNTKQILSFLSFVVFSGCTTIATYPPIEHETARSFANSSKEPVPTIMAEAISYTHKHFGGMDRVVFNLPQGVDREAYSIVAKKLGDAVPMKNANEIAYHIVELRLRGFEADADVVFPVTMGGYEMATIHLESSIVDPWVVTNDRVWLIPTSDMLLPNYTVEEVVEVDAVEP